MTLCFSKIPDGDDGFCVLLGRWPQIWGVR
jgi:hypothetical protein